MLMFFIKFSWKFNPKGSIHSKSSLPGSGAEQVNDGPGHWLTV